MTNNDHKKTIKSQVIAMLKEGSPVLLNIANPSHTMVITQVFEINGMYIFNIYDNNNPYKSSKDAPYVFYSSVNDIIYRNSYNKDDYDIDTITVYGDIRSYNILSARCNNDTQNIYNLRDKCEEYNIQANRITDLNGVLLSSKSDSYAYNIDKIRITVIGAEIRKVVEKENGETITLIPEGDIINDKEIIYKSYEGLSNILFLPLEEIYRIDIAKPNNLATVMVFITIPNTDGTVQKINYKNIPAIETESSSIYFYVGRNNTDTSLKINSATSSLQKNIIQTYNTYDPDYNASLKLLLLSPTNFTAVTTSNSTTAVKMTWTNGSNVSSVKIVRKEGEAPSSSDDGISIYQGTDTTVTDTSVASNTIYYYAAYSIGSDGTYSDTSTVSVDTSKYGIYGTVNLDNGSVLKNAAVSLMDSSGNTLSTSYTNTNGYYSFANLSADSYTVSIDTSYYKAAESTKSVTISDQSVNVDFSVSEKSMIKILSSDSYVDADSTTVPINWTDRKIPDNSTISISFAIDSTWYTMPGTYDASKGFTYLTISDYLKNLQSPASTLTVKLSLSSDVTISDNKTFSIYYKPTEFNGNILWRNKVDGTIALWKMNGTTPSDVQVLPTVADTSWQIAVTANFVSQSNESIIWRNNIYGYNAIWGLTGTYVTSVRSLQTIADLEWEIAGTGNFSRTGYVDIIWRNKITGQNVAWTVKSGTISAVTMLPSVEDTKWKIVGIRDFDGDDLPDILWRNTETGVNCIWLMNGYNVKDVVLLPSAEDPTWELVAISDIKGTNKTNSLIWRNKITGQNVFWTMKGTSVDSSYILPTVEDLNWEIVGPK